MTIYGPDGQPIPDPHRGRRCPPADHQHYPDWLGTPERPLVATARACRCGKHRRTLLTGDLLKAFAVGR